MWRDSDCDCSRATRWRQNANPMLQPQRIAPAQGRVLWCKSKQCKSSRLDWRRVTVPIGVLAGADTLTARTHVLDKLVKILKQYQCLQAARRPGGRLHLTRDSRKPNKIFTHISHAPLAPPTRSRRHTQVAGGESHEHVLCLEQKAGQVAEPSVRCKQSHTQ